MGEAPVSAKRGVRPKRPKEADERELLFRAFYWRMA